MQNEARCTGDALVDIRAHAWRGKVVRGGRSDAGAGLEYDRGFILKEVDKRRRPDHPLKEKRMVAHGESLSNCHGHIPSHLARPPNPSKIGQDDSNTPVHPSRDPTLERLPCPCESHPVTPPRLHPPSFRLVPTSTPSPLKHCTFGLHHPLLHFPPAVGRVGSDPSHDSLQN